MIDKFDSNTRLETLIVIELPIIGNNTSITQ